MCKDYQQAVDLRATVNVVVILADFLSVLRLTLEQARPPLHGVLCPDWINSAGTPENVFSLLLHERREDRTHNNCLTSTSQFVPSLNNPDDVTVM